MTSCKVCKKKVLLSKPSNDGAFAAVAWGATRILKGTLSFIKSDSSEQLAKNEEKYVKYMKSRIKGLLNSTQTSLDDLATDLTQDPEGFFKKIMKDKNFQGSNKEEESRIKQKDKIFLSRFQELENFLYENNLLNKQDELTRIMRDVRNLDAHQYKKKQDLLNEMDDSLQTLSWNLLKYKHQDDNKKRLLKYASYVIISLSVFWYQDTIFYLCYKAFWKICAWVANFYWRGLRRKAGETYKWFEERIEETAEAIKKNAEFLAKKTAENFEKVKKKAKNKIKKAKENIKQNPLKSALALISVVGASLYAFIADESNVALSEEPVSADTALKNNNQDNNSGVETTEALKNNRGKEGTRVTSLRRQTTTISNDNKSTTTTPSKQAALPSSQGQTNKSGTKGSQKQDVSNIALGSEASNNTSTTTTQPRQAAFVSIEGNSGDEDTKKDKNGTSDSTITVSSNTSAAKSAKEIIQYPQVVDTVESFTRSLSNSPNAFIAVNAANDAIGVTDKFGFTRSESGYSIHNFTTGVIMAQYFGRIARNMISSKEQKTSSRRRGQLLEHVPEFLQNQLTQQKDTMGVVKRYDNGTVTYAREPTSSNFRQLEEEPLNKVLGFVEKEELVYASENMNPDGDNSILFIDTEKYSNDWGQTGSSLDLRPATKENSTQSYAQYLVQLFTILSFLSTNIDLVGHEKNNNLILE